MAYKISLSEKKKLLNEYYSYETEKDGVERINPRLNRDNWKTEYDYKYKDKIYNRTEAIKKGLLFRRIKLDKYRVLDLPL